MTLPGNLRGAALMAAAALLFALEALFIRWMTARGIPITTPLLFRCLGQVLWIAPARAAGGPAMLRTAWPLLHGLRGACPPAPPGLASATVRSFTHVMFTTLPAAPLLRARP